MHTEFDNLTIPAPVERARRRRIAGREPARHSVDRFQSVARALAGRGDVPTLDGIASAARRLLEAHAGHAVVPGIRQRRRCLQALRMLAREPGWSLAPDQARRIALLSGYDQGDQRLVPDGVPVIGGLDTAVLLDLAWPEVAAEAEAYLDFRRMRIEEALLRGLHPRDFRFGRDEWLEASRAERALIAHVRERGQQSYVPGAPPPLFVVH